MSGSDPRWRLRLCYAKTGRPRFISHLDFIRLFERAARRSGMPLAFSEGFSPAPKIAYGWPLPVGMSSLAEYVDVELTGRVPPEEAMDLLNRGLPTGIEIRDASYVSPHGPSLMAEFNTAAYAVHLDSLGRDLEAWCQAATKLLQHAELKVVRERGGSTGGEVKRKVVDVRPLIKRLEVREVSADGRVVVFTELENSDKGAGRPDEVAGLLVREIRAGEREVADEAGEGQAVVDTAGQVTGEPQPVNKRLPGFSAVRLGLRREA